jgi:hypothetical protein
MSDESDKAVAECEAAFKRLDELENSLYWIRRMKREIEEDKQKKSAVVAD